MKKYLIITAGLLIGFSSCVSKKKYRESQRRVAGLQSDSSATHVQLSNCNTTLADCNNKVAGLEKEKGDIMSNYDKSKETIANSSMTIADQAKRLKELQRLIQSQKDALTNLKNTVAKALVNFPADELSVSQKDGKLYVSLQEKLLFKSGSADVDPKGKEALQKLAEVLNNTADISVMIEGHTDTVPIRGKFEDNWALSTARATSIVRILTKSYAVDARRVIASGRGEFFPIEDNKTAEGRARNRRTEIILTPNLNELFKLLNQ